MTDSLLDVVIIAKQNTSLRFLRTLNSVLFQIYSPIEITVVDMNEPDSMYSLGLQEDLADFPQVKYLRLEQSLSGMAVRNYVLQHVRGEYIAFLNSRDVWDSTKALVEVQKLKEDEKAATICGGGLLIDERKFNVTIDSLIENVSYDRSKWLLNNPAKMSAQVIYQTEALRGEEGFDGDFENFCDGDMLFRLSRNHKVLFSSVSLCKCYITPDNDMYDRSNLRDRQKILYKYMENFLVDRHLTQSFYGQMIYLAKINYQWINFVAYIFMYFIKSPVRAVLTILKKAGLSVFSGLKWIRRELSIARENLKIHRDIYRMRRGKAHKIRKQKSSHIRNVLDEPVVFSSARQYNEKNALSFTFSHKLESIVIPEHVTVIKHSMFYGCSHLVSIEIPNTVTEISDHAFHGCRHLRRVIIQEGSRLGKIGAYAFAGCSELEKISLPSSMVQIGKYAFAECLSLKQMFFTYPVRGEEKTSSIFPVALNRLSRGIFAGCINLSGIEFGEGSMLEILEADAFLGCAAIERIVLTGSVNTLGNYAFAYCKKLETAAFTQIDALKNIGKSAFMHCQMLDYFQFSNQIERIKVRTFYSCFSLKQIKITKKVLSIGHQAFAKCSALEQVLILTGDIAISPTAFDRHTKILVQEQEEQFRGNNE